MTNGKILIVDDNKNILSALELLLMPYYKTVKSISNPNQLTSLTNLESFDVVLLDMNFKAGVNSGNEGLFWLSEIKKKAPNIIVIMITAYGAIDLAVASLKKGASDFVLKPWNNEKLLTTIKTSFLLVKSQKEVGLLKKKQAQLKDVINRKKNLIIGNSKAITTVLKLVHKVAKTDANVLVTGENGTGKELIARELHAVSQRNTEVFITVDMGAIAENLFESELFGHVRGAFTDAKEDRVGKFEAANGGTLFLDEIGNLSLGMQAKLLSAIQNRKITRVGTNEEITFDIRLICATNCDLDTMVQQGKFREDLLYRINTIHVEVPALRYRNKDILLMADFFIKRFAHKYGKGNLKINEAVEQKFLGYKWPGNVRELQHTIERAVILSDQNELKPIDFLLKNQTATIATNINMPNTIEEMERLMIDKALNENEGNYSATANQLGISRQTLYNKIKKSL